MAQNYSKKFNLYIFNDIDAEFLNTHLGLITDLNNMGLLDG